MEKGKNTILTMIIIATIFGLGSGIVGAIVARVYILENALNVPLFGEIDFSSARFGGSNLVISGAKKVVVEQNDKVTETLNSVQSNIVGIFSKKSTSTDNVALKDGDILDNLYNLEEELGQAFIITSDGWIVTSFTPNELLKPNIAGENTKMNFQVARNYVVISKNKEIYEVDEIVMDPGTAYAYWHIKAEGLPVKRFITREDVANGDLVISVNWDGWTWISSIVDKDHGTIKLVKDSDISNNLFKLDNEPSKDFYGSFLFNLNGDVLAMINRDGKVEPIYNYTSCITCLLRSKEVKRPSLGVYYVDLADFVGLDRFELSSGALITKNELGVAIKKDSPAYKAGLKEGDLIISVNNILLEGNKTLSSFISEQQVGDEIDLLVEREGERRNIALILEEL